MHTRYKYKYIYIFANACAIKNNMYLILNACRYATCIYTPCKNIL